MALFSTIARLALFLLLCFAVVAALADPPRIAGPVVESDRVRLPGSLHPLALPAADQGPVDPSLPTGRLLLLLARSAAQESALQDFLRAAHTPGDPAFHRWLKPADFARLFGPAHSDLAAVTAWLQSHGLTVLKLHAGSIEFSGTAAQLTEAFHAPLHRYAIHGESHLSAAADPSVPAALAPVLAGLASLTDFQPQPQLKLLGPAAFNAKTHLVTPTWTYPSSTGVAYALAPGDFATQYDIKPVYTAGISGAGQSIAIVSASNIDLSLVQAYQSLFALPANLPVVVVDGPDPGQNSAAALEAYLDVEIASSVAPKATILLYTSAGSALTSGLALAALRAVDDDQAGLISLSYSECEAELGQGGNAFWNALWQQAAAQGQSVFVAAGDSGSAACDSPAQASAYAGLAVNGIASTPYNVAVGGTDFYYSQYANGSSAVASQLASFWSSPTTAPAVSLLQPIPEQPWNDFFGLNLADGGNPASLAIQTIAAAGGGSSSAALYPSSGASGYPKPAWQSGSGVPADKLRDLPDLALFAGNAYNSSFYPICANPGDCANLNASGAVVITAIGGSSAGAPAMAAIQALVNQSAATWSGQPNFVYYPLAATQPSVFRDVTLGGNQVQCYPGTPNCVSGPSGSLLNYWVESGYPATPGYDQATGLGSVDVANLIKYWRSVSFKPTTTTLAVTPSTLVHGKTATVTATVAPASASGTPTGSIALTAADGLPGSTGLGDFPLTAASVYAPMDNLPGGTYQLTAVYSGDTNFAASKSAPLTVTVTPEAGTLQSTGWAWNPSDLNLYPLAPGMTVPYGAQILLDAQIVSANATLANQPTPATGNVTFADKAASSTQPLNVSGLAEWATGVFAPGVHTIGESYSGDPSYAPVSLPTAASFTVIPGATTLTVLPLATSVAAGSSLAVQVQIATGYLPLSGTLPTGNVTVTLGSLTSTAAVQPFGPAGSSILQAVVSFANLPAGILPVSAYYPGDANWQPAAANGPTVLALSAKPTPTVALTASSASPAPSQTLTLTAAVAGPPGKPAPTGTVLFTGNAQTLTYTATLAAGSASVSFPAYAAANGVNLFTAVYQGDANYSPATSNPVTVTIPQTDFSLTTATPQLAIAPGKSATAVLQLNPINGFAGTVTLATPASSSSGSVSAALSNPTAAVSAPTTCLLTLSVAPSIVPGVYPVTLTATSGGHVHTAQILVSALAAAPPVFTPPAGTYSSAQSVTLASPTSGALIYFTTSGATPTSSSTRYSAPIPVAATETIKAIAIAPGLLPSPVASAAFTISPLAAAPKFSPPAGTYSAPQSVAISDSTPNAVLYYSTNGSAPTTGSTRYTAPIPVAVTQTIQAIAVAANYQQSPVTAATYTIHLPLAATPKFSPPAGTYSSAQSVTISDSTTNATVYYTTDGSAPATSSARYISAIPVTATQTIKAIAVAANYQQSAVAASTYTINLPLTATPKITPPAGTYSAAQTVTLTDTTANAVIYYTTNSTAPTTSSTRYSAPFKVSATQTVKAIAVAPGFAPSAVVSAAYTITAPSGHLLPRIYLKPARGAGR